MDFSNQYHPFTGGAQPAFHSFNPLPPLTPSHSQSGPSDDYSNSQSEAFEPLPSADSSFNPMEYTQQAFQNQNQNYPGPPGPPTPPNPASFGQQQKHQSLPSLGGDLMIGPFDDGYPPSIKGDRSNHDKSEIDDMSNGRGGSEEDLLSPAQSKRKAQNRKAQRAFRERKEKHVKDLESKLADLEAARDRSTTENERLLRDLQRMATENEILKATAASNQHSGSGRSGSYSSPEPPMTTGPMNYNPKDFASAVLEGHDNKAFSHRIVQSDDGQRLLATGASWDFIANHDYFLRGILDIGVIAEYLRTRALCDGQGPVFREDDVVQAIELSAAAGTDDLL